eukprot:07095.XXX_447168_447386_1 [CDS] Oithona nana genome sequencing.
MITSGWQGGGDSSTEGLLKLVIPIRPLVGFLGGKGGGEPWLLLLDGFSGSFGGISTPAATAEGNGRCVPEVS